jgi:hypothetical protein
MSLRNIRVSINVTPKFCHKTLVKRITSISDFPFGSIRRTTTAHRQCGKRVFKYLFKEDEDA